MAVASWGGAVIAFAFIFPPSLVEGNGLLQQLVAGVADRFYVFFGPVLALIVTTGLYNAWIEVGL